MNDVTARKRFHRCKVVALGPPVLGLSDIYLPITLHQVDYNNMEPFFIVNV